MSALKLTEFLLARIAKDEARSDAEEREAVRGMTNPPHYELNDGTCVSCGETWQCSKAWLE